MLIFDSTNPKCCWKKLVLCDFDSYDFLILRVCASMDPFSKRASPRHAIQSARQPALDSKSQARSLRILRDLRSHESFRCKSFSIERYHLFYRCWMFFFVVRDSKISEQTIIYTNVESGKIDAISIKPEYS